MVIITVLCVPPIVFYIGATKQYGRQRKGNKEDTHNIGLNHHHHGHRHGHHNLPLIIDDSNQAGHHHHHHHGHHGHHHSHHNPPLIINDSNQAPFYRLLPDCSCLATDAVC